MNENFYHVQEVVPMIKISQKKKQEAVSNVEVIVTK